MASHPAAGLAQGSAGYRSLTLAMLFAGFATFSQLYALQPLLPQFAAEFRLSAEEASLAVSLATAPLAVMILLAGPVSDRFGRRRLMVIAMFAASVLTVLAGLAPGWHALLFLRFLTGLALGGVPAVAMAYVSEEVEPRSVGPAMGLYIAGNAIGGMCGRLGIGLVTEFAGWHWAVALTGVTALALAEGFRRLAPPSRRFVAQPSHPRAVLAAMRGLFRDAALPLLFLESFVLMGAFISIYNYAAFRLSEAPFGLGHAAIGAIFLLYILGSVSSARFGALAERYGRRHIFWAPIVLMLAGIGLTAAPQLWLVIAGIAVVTIGFFGAHSIASSWVGRRALTSRGQASALYLFCYYAGSSVLGSAGGIAWTRWGWNGVVLYCAALVLIGLALAVRLVAVPPLAIPEARAVPIPAD